MSSPGDWRPQRWQRVQRVRPSAGARLHIDASSRTCSIRSKPKAQHDTTGPRPGRATRHGPRSSSRPAWRRHCRWHAAYEKKCPLLEVPQPTTWPRGARPCLLAANSAALGPLRETSRRCHMKSQAKLADPAYFYLLGYRRATRARSGSPGTRYRSHDIPREI